MVHDPTFGSDVLRRPEQGRSGPGPCLTLRARSSLPWPWPFISGAGPPIYAVEKADDEDK